MRSEAAEQRLRSGIIAPFLNLKVAHEQFKGYFITISIYLLQLFYLFSRENPVIVSGCRMKTFLSCLPLLILSILHFPGIKQPLKCFDTSAYVQMKQILMAEKRHC